MYRLMAIAKYDDRYVIPTAHDEQAHDLEEIGCSVDLRRGAGMYVRDVRRGQRSTGPGGRRDVRRAQAAPDLRGAIAPAERAARSGQPAQLGRQRRTGRALPATSATERRRRRGAAPAATRDDRVVHQVAACCSTTRPTSSLERLPAAARSALAEQPASPATRD